MTEFSHLRLVQLVIYANGFKILVNLEHCHVMKGLSLYHSTEFTIVRIQNNNGGSESKVAQKD